MLIHTREGNILVQNIQNRILGNQRSGVSVGTEAQMGEVQNGWIAAPRSKRLCVVSRSLSGIQCVDRHGVDVFRQDRCMPKQALVQVREVAVGIPIGRDPLIDLKDVHVSPRHVLGAKECEHRPRSLAAADCQ